MPQSLQCPRCNGAVSVADDAAGQRVKCPHCEQTFLAPGIAASANDDDDWLQLEESPVAPSPLKPPTKPTPKSPTPAAPPAAGPGVASTPKPTEKKPRKSATPSLSDEDEALLAEFTSDLDDFTAEIETPPPPHPSSPAAKAATKPTAARPTGNTAPAPVPKSAPAPEANKVEYATDYSTKCNICGTILYVKAAQAGKTVKCSDCYSPVTVPPPPKKKKKTQINIEEAQTFEFEESKPLNRGPDPYQKSAAQLLEEASRVEEESPTPTFDDTPSVKEWAMNVFGVFLDIGVLVHWVGLSLVATLAAVIALGSGMNILILGLFPAGLILAVLTVSCGFAIMHAVANQEKTVSDWPTLDPMAWFGQLFVAVAAACVAAVPIWIVSMLLLGPHLLTTAITMLFVYIFFPFVLLSMLDMNNALVPFSPEVARSVNKCQEAWGGFYFSAGLLFVGLFLLFAMVSSMAPTVAAPIAIFATIGISFAYFSLIGRLAYAIGQAVNAPPRKEEAEEEG